jgi:hypothetical protein
MPLSGVTVSDCMLPSSTLLNSCPAGPHDIILGQTQQKTPFLAVSPLLHGVAIHADHTEITVHSSTSTGYMA